jgi:hypothetical protein
VISWFQAFAFHKCNLYRYTATTIQAAWRMRRERAAFVALRAAAVSLQARRKGGVERAAFLRRRDAAVVVGLYKLN